MTNGVRLEAINVGLDFFMPRSGKKFSALENVNLKIYDGEFISIVGPSGCGKTTFLNAVDGLLKISKGRLILDGKQITGPGRDRAMVFQSASLLPWRTVLKNVVYGLELQGVNKKEAKERAVEAIRLVGLEGWEDHFPSELSGGMQQRANLARALTTDPEILLLDEPFANLDAQTREFMQYELLKIWRKSRKTTIFITHQINEAIYLSDRVVVFTCGPGTVKDIVNIEIPRPRKLNVKRDPLFLKYEDQIWGHIEEEVRKNRLMVIDDEGEEDGKDFKAAELSDFSVI